MMDLFYTRSRQYRAGQTLGTGAQGGVRSVDGHPELVVKILTSPPADLEQKLRTMITKAPPPNVLHNRGNWEIAWPQDIVYSGPDLRHCIGFTMSRIANKRLYFDLRQELTTKVNTDQHFCCQVALNLAGAVAAVHAAGFVLCDLNDRNVMVSQNSRDPTIAIIDCDSWQVRKGSQTFRSPYYCVEFLPPELQGKDLSRIDRKPEHDLFALGELIFELLHAGHHAFATTYAGPGNVPNIADRIKNGRWPNATTPHAHFPPRIDAPPLSRLPSQIQQEFTRCFEYGIQDPACRPTADEWLSVLSTNRNAMPATTYPQNRVMLSNSHFDRARLRRWIVQGGVAACLTGAACGLLQMMARPVSVHSPSRRPQAQDIQSVYVSKERAAATPAIWRELARDHK